MNSNANDRYGSSLERTLGAGKSVDPATRLSELLAQSLEELTRPFDPPRPGAPAHLRPVPAEAAPSQHAEAVQEPQQPEPPPPPPQQPHEPAAAAPEVEVKVSEASRLDTDRALAELEAELFAAAKQVDREHADAVDDDEHQAEGHHPEDLDHIAPQSAAGPTEGHEKDLAGFLDIMASTPRTADAVPAPDADAAGVIARVRRLMLVSMAITVIAVGSVFGLIGYRMYKTDAAAAAKTADKLPESSPIPTDVTLSLPRGARVVQSAVANDRLVMTLEIDGKLEVRTFDLKTLQPTGRLNFSATP